MTAPIHLPPSRMQTAQDAVARAISRLPLFVAHDIPVGSEEEGDLVSLIHTEIAKGLGLYVFVTIAQGRDPMANVPGPRMKNVALVMGVWSNPLMHPGAPRIKPIIEYIMSSMHLYQAEGFAAPLEMDNPAFKRLPWKGAVYYELYFKTMIHLTNQTEGVSL